mmetsp:Transcript_15826/g.28789  ORF Transcript_15826/g.28789 Transcript_15826/m.28789 type:complete len:204 (+) Transcript_15826:683-1294(+)
MICSSEVLLHLFILNYLDEESLEDPRGSAQASTMSPEKIISSTIEQQWFSQNPQGLLYKQKHTFRSQFQPMWCVLHIDRQVLGYHHLVKSTLPMVDTNKFNVFSKKAPQTTASDHDLIAFEPVPRGIVYLNECRVEINEKLSCPSKNIFAFTITPMEEGDNDTWTLAATTEETRLLWVAMLADMSEQYYDAKSFLASLRVSQT